MYLVISKCFPVLITPYDIDCMIKSLRFLLWSVFLNHLPRSTHDIHVGPILAPSGKELAVSDHDSASGRPNTDTNTQPPQQNGLYGFQNTAQSSEEEEMEEEGGGAASNVRAPRIMIDSIGSSAVSGMFMYVCEAYASIIPFCLIPGPHPLKNIGLLSTVCTCAQFPDLLGIRHFPVISIEPL